MDPDSAEGACNQEARDRAASYGFLAWLFLENADAAFLERLLAMDGAGGAPPSLPAGGTSTAILAGLHAMRSYLAEGAYASTEEACLDLATQRTRLFRGLAAGCGPPPPYEAVYRCPKEGTEPEVMLQVGSFYREAAVRLPPDYSERLDYIGLELDLMRLLCEEEDRRWTVGDREGASRWRVRQQGFLREHLLAWAPRYCEVLMADKNAGFYRGVAQLLIAFLDSEASSLPDRRNVAVSGR